MCGFLTSLYLFGELTMANNIAGNNQSQLIGIEQTVIDCDDGSVKLGISDYKEEGYRTLDTQEMSVKFKYKLK